MKTTGTPESGYIQGAIQSKKDLPYPHKLTINIVVDDYKKSINAQDAGMPVVLPLSACFEKR